MRLRKIELTGFKSFADRTVLHFDEGITAVVGPNGCGKSNIIDAFRWVMGEQSAKSMRGDKMLDVIFAGSAKRKASNYAEVALSFAEVEGYLPVDYDEVLVSRRVYRSGESEYRINRNLVRMKDVQSLFLGSGIGKGAFSIFEQGKIDQIILNNPVQRRYVFEEAAGILRFKQSKKEALSKLEQTQSNLERARDIHDEVKKQMESLGKQAKAAKEYKGNKNRLELLEKAIFREKWKGLKEKVEDLSQKQQQLEEERQKVQKVYEDLEGLESSLQEEMQQSNEDYQKAREGVVQLRGEQDVVSAEERNRLDRVRDADARTEQLQKETEAIGESLKENKTNSKDASKKLEALEKLLSKEKENYQKSEGKVLNAEEEIQVFLNRQKVMQSRLVEALEASAKWELNAKQSVTRMEACLEKRQILQDKSEGLQQAMEGLSQEAVEKKKLLDQISDGIDRKKEKMDQIEEKVQALQEEVTKQTQDCKRTQENLSFVKARKEALLRLQKEMEGLSSDTQKLLKETQKKGGALFGLIQPLYELICVSKEQQGAVSAALKPYSQTLVVQTKKAKEAVLCFAQEKKLKEFSLFCLEDLKSDKKVKKSLSKARPLLEDQEQDVLMTHFLGDVYLCEDLAESFQILQLQEGIEVFVDGKWLLDRFSVLSSSSLGESNAFARQSEVVALGKELLKLEKTVERLQNSLLLKEESLSEYRAQFSEADRDIRREEMKLVEVNVSLQVALADEGKAKKSLSEAQEEMASLKKQVTQFEKAVQEAEGNLAKAKAQLSQQRQVSEQEEQNLSERQEVLERIRKETRQASDVYLQRGEEVRKLSGELKTLEIQEEDLKKSRLRLDREVESLKKLKEQTTKQEEVFRLKKKETEDKLGSLQKSCDQLKERLEKKKEGLLQVTEKMRKALEKLKRLDEKKSSLSFRCVREAAGREALESSFQERYQLSMEELFDLDLPDLDSVEIAEKETARLRRQMDQAGDINMASIEEYEQHKERYEFLNNQLNDIGGSQEDLLKIIAKLDRSSRKRLKQTFEAIRVNFKKNFSILFGGGESDLKLTESADILDAGIEIIAQPPGKQMRSISLLSGGEKCMTAMALLFAFFEVKPAPFCLLDEIDAPLDDSNIARFVNVLTQFIDDTQFVIVTHNKRTMQIADILVGVSMEEKGVSKLLSLEFHAEEEKQKEKEMLATLT